MINYNTDGITAEDLEKAASVRLFEKAAAAEGINLAELTEDQVEDLYSAYTSQENDMDLIDLFEKQASVEGVDLDALSDEELQGAYANFVAAVEAEHAEQEAVGGEEVTYDEVNDYLTDRQDEVIGLMKEAGYFGYDEEVKEASGLPDGGSSAASFKDRAAAAGRYMKDKATAAGSYMKANPGKTIGGLALAGGLGYGGKKLMDRRKAKKAMEKQAGEEMLLNAFDEELQNAYGVTAADLSDEQFAGLYDEFLSNVGDNIVKEAQAEIEASEKLAEAEVLGRHMAQAFNDELEKQALSMQDVKDKASAAGAYMKNKAQQAGQYAKANPGRVAGGLAVAGGLGYGAKKLMDKKKAKKAMEKEAEYQDEVLLDWFEKQASYEGIDFDDYSDEDVDIMFDNFLGMFTEDDVEALVKEAGIKEKASAAGKYIKDQAVALGGKIKANPKTSAGIAAGTIAAGYGAKKLMDKRKAKKMEKAASSLLRARLY